MSGPTVGILLKEKLSIENIKSLYQEIKNYSIEIDKKDIESNGFDFWINDGKSLGTSYFGEGLPFGIIIEEVEFDETEENLIYQAVNYFPKQEIIIISYCNGKYEHLILANLAIMITEKFNGIIDMGGKLPSSYSEINDGSIWEISYGKDRVYHLSDVGFLKKWVQHPNFLMIK
ncbi:DUF6368 family protein [Gottfriedia solisilvae]|uniref:Uncharacterized protein n=1 Tax=Gottfriedia solisilvae TaxID=1516104 RepID=A0A8J3AFN2_9BACI|nr:DUF6368 family protein [Gottfriedia solisilvae]GGI11707.1 hypothetical protein GCM10007380_09190 [Gottfriedia solisilvae]